VKLNKARRDHEHEDREAVLPGALKGRVYHPQGWLSLVVLVDGRMEGVWRYERRGDRLSVGIEPFARQPDWVRRAAEEEAERLARFVGSELELSGRTREEVRQTPAGAEEPSASPDRKVVNGYPLLYETTYLRASPQRRRA